MASYSELVQALRAGGGAGKIMRAGVEGAESGAAMSREDQKNAFQQKVSSFLAGELGDAKPAGMPEDRPLSENAFLKMRGGAASSASGSDDPALLLDAVNTARTAAGLDPIVPSDKGLNRTTANAQMRGAGIAAQTPERAAKKKQQSQVVAEFPALRDVSLAVNRVTKAWKPEYTGAGDALGQELSSATGNADPAYVNMVQGIATAFNKIAKAQSGAVINQEELKRLADQFPKQWRSDTDFTSRLNAWISDFNSVLDYNASMAGPGLKSQYNAMKLVPINTTAPAKAQPAAVAPAANDDAKIRRMKELGLIEGE